MPPTLPSKRNNVCTHKEKNNKNTYNQVMCSDTTD